MARVWQPELSVAMKAKLIVNPVAGTDAGPDHLATINARLRQRAGPLDIVMTVAEHDAEHAARQAVEDGYDHIFVAGGDGTLNEVLNGVAGVDGGLDAVTLGVIPLGTGNDFATALGIPEDVEAAVEALLDGHVIRVDVGRVNARAFVNVSAGGFIAEVSDAVSPKLKTLVGKLAYLVGGAKVLLDYEPVHARVRPAPDESSIPLHAFAVCNSRLVGGGRLIAPHARVDDGELDVCLIRAMPTGEFIGLLRRVSGGEHIEDERVTYFRARRLSLSFDRAIKINTDGQVLETDRCEYDVLPGAARFLAPNV
jgi:diacylglycerol kinase (ATP)